MQATRSMDPKVKIKNFPISNEALASTSKRPSSSFFLAMIISLLEIFIKFKYSPEYLQIFSDSFRNLLKKAKKYASSNYLNSDILRSFKKILQLLLNTRDPIIAFQYLSFYSESQELDCSIALEFTMRFIFAALVCEEDRIEESIIIEDKGIRSFGKVLEKLTFELPINVVIFAGSQKKCFLNKRTLKNANIFLMKEENKFWLVYPRECWEIMRNFPSDQSLIEKFPHFYYDEKNFIKPGFSKSGISTRNIEESKNPFDSDSPDNQFNHSSTLHSPAHIQNQLLSTSLDSTDSNSLITLSKRKILKILELLNKRINHDLSETFKSYFETNFIRSSISIKDFSSFLDSYLPNQSYPRQSIKRLAFSLHRPLKSVKIKENIFWEIIINLEVNPIHELFSKSDFIKSLMKLIKYLIQIKLQSEFLIKA